MSLEPLDWDRLCADPHALIVAFTDAVKAYAHAPNDADLQCRVLLLGGCLAGVAIRTLPEPARTAVMLQRFTRSR